MNLVYVLVLIYYAPFTSDIVGVREVRSFQSAEACAERLHRIHHYDDPRFELFGECIPRHVAQ